MDPRVARYADAFLPGARVAAGTLRSVPADAGLPLRDCSIWSAAWRSMAGSPGKGWERCSGCPIRLMKRRRHRGWLATGRPPTLRNRTAMGQARRWP